MNRGAATAVPTVCSEQTSILHHICSVYVFLLSVAVDPLYKLYGSVIVPLLLLTHSYTGSTVHNYGRYQSNYKYICALNIHNLSLNITIKYRYHN